MTNSISLQSARDLSAARAIRQAVIEAYGNRFCLAFDIGTERRPLASQRDPIRHFKTVEAVLKVLNSIGINEAVVDTRRWNDRDLPLR